MIVEYIEHKNIDKHKWDDCVNNAINGLIYGQSFYLDKMAVNWDGIVLGNYDAVMPIIWKKKWGIRYLYQPAFVQQSGIFFTINLGDDDIELFYNVLTKHFKFAEITGNFLSFPSPHISFVKTIIRNNFIINLKQDYSTIVQNYSSSCKKSLNRIKKFGLFYRNTDDFLSTIELYKNLYSKKLPFISNKDYFNFKNLCNNLVGEQEIITRQVYNANNDLLCAVVLLKSKNRIYNIISCITIAGKKLEANYYLYDNLFREFSGEPLIFDFEGSDGLGIANFYLKFGPQNQPYPFIYYNNLNLILKIFKH